VTSAPALALRNICKAFGGVHALDNASLVVERGSVHGLIGQNGAGKSTLIKILAGIQPTDSGAIEIFGAPQFALTPRKVEALGVHFIHQDRLLAPSLTVAEALLLGDEPRWPCTPFLNRRELNAVARDALKRAFDIDLAVDDLVRNLSNAEQQIVQITRALRNQPKVLVFDEPTTALVWREADFLFEAIRRLRREGLTVLYISHYLNEIRDLCDSVTVLRNGRDVARVDARATPTSRLVSLMIDRNVDTLFPSRERRLGAVALETKDLTLPGEFRDVTLSLRKGEILGVTGLVGSGAKGLARALFGLAVPTSGTWERNGETVSPKNPMGAIARGVGLVPEDRRRHGVALDLSVKENASLASLDRLGRFGFLDFRAEAAGVNDLIERLSILTPSAGSPVRALSGGNQQKVALAKWLLNGAEVIILDEPTVGVDVAAKADIYREIAKLAAGGAAIVLVSSDLMEIQGLADRVLVFFRGEVVADVETTGLDSDRLLTLVTTGREERQSHVYAEA
jgi:ribose transport system ATP-binding protein